MTVSLAVGGGWDVEVTPGWVTPRARGDVAAGFAFSDGEVDGAIEES